MTTSLDVSGHDVSGLDVPGPGRAPESAEHCCPHHRDWPSLAQHLLDEFPEATISEIVREVRRARDAVDDLGMDEDEAVGVGEAMAHNQLGMLTGRIRSA